MAAADAPPAAPTTLAAFRLWEPWQAARYEFIGGATVAKPALSADAERFAMTLAGHLSLMLRGRPCRVPMPPAPVTVGEEVFRPDVAVSCQPMFGQGENAAGPLVAIDLRPAPAGREALLTLPGLRHWLVIDTHAQRAVHHHRHGAEWRRVVVAGPDGRIEIDSLDIALPLSALFTG